MTHVDIREAANEPPMKLEMIQKYRWYAFVFSWLFKLKNCPYEYWQASPR